MSNDNVVPWSPFVTSFDEDEEVNKSDSHQEEAEDLATLDGQNSGNQDSGDGPQALFPTTGKAGLAPSLSTELLVLDPIIAHAPTPVVKAETWGEPQCPPKTALAAAIETALTSIENGVQDLGAPYDAIDAWSFIRKESPRDYANLRAKLKAVSGFLIGDFERRLAPVSSSGGGGDINIKNIVEFVRARAELFRSQDGFLYATVNVAEHQETFEIQSSGFTEWLESAVYDYFKEPLPESITGSVKGILKGYAKRQPEPQQVANRACCLVDNLHYVIDLCDSDWKTIEVKPSGWQIAERPQVKFFRHGSECALPNPVTGSNLVLLWQLVNIPRKYRLLVIAWLIDALRPETPYVILQLFGEQGTVKSTTQTILRMLFDPSTNNLRQMSNSVRDLNISAFRNYVLSLENVSFLTREFQDALCSISTGSGYSARTLHTNSQETLLKIKRPVILNGISASITSMDLLDRTISVLCPRVEEKRLDAPARREFERHYPALFAALLDQFVEALRMLPEVSIPGNQLPRMSDFAILAEAVYLANGCPPRKSLEDFQSLRLDTARHIIDSHPVATAIIDYLNMNPEGLVHSPDEPLIVKDAFEILMRTTSQSRDWPRTPKGFADTLRRLSPILAQLGIEAEIGERCRLGYPVTIRRMDALESDQSGSAQAGGLASSALDVPGALGGPSEADRT